MSKENKTEKEQIIAFLLMCLKNWYYFAISMAICVILGIIYLKVVKPVWEVSAKVSLTEDDSLVGKGISQSQSLMSAFGMGGGRQNVEDESNKMASHGYIKKVVKNLDLNKVYVLSKNLGMTKKQLYDKSPVVISSAPVLSDTLTGFVEFIIDVKGESATVKLKLNKKTIGKYEIKALPSTIDTQIGQFTLSKSAYFDEHKKPCKIKVLFTNYDYMAQLYMAILDIDFEKKNSNIINLILNHENTVLAKRLLNEIVAVYNANWQEDKNILSEKTTNFIDERLELVKNDLDVVDREIQSFKGENNLTDIEADVTYYFTMNAELQAKIIEAKTQLELVDIIFDFVKEENRKFTPVPYSAIILDPALVEVVSNYNEILMKRNEWHKNSNTITSAIQGTDEQIEAQRQNLLQSLENIKKGMKISLNELSKKEKEIDSKINNLPYVEREFVILKREQTIQQTIYLFLVEKREETVIKAVSLLPKLKIIDDPYTAIIPVSPSPKKVALLILFFGGFAIPLSIIYFIPFIRNIRNRKK
jgi:uncharacterized protein involved in exopolysaccharide biosynthesis